MTNEATAILIQSITAAGSGLVRSLGWPVCAVLGLMFGLVGLYQLFALVCEAIGYGVGIKAGGGLVWESESQRQERLWNEKQDRSAEWRWRREQRFNGPPAPRDDDDDDDDGSLPSLRGY